MSDRAIIVDDLSKRYQLGSRQAGRTLREALSQSLSFPTQRRKVRSEETEFWALRDVTFDVKRGEVFGIIGSNGAGKSTLLKILSRIAEPTSGRAEVFGRVGSLLEVGTGFHPELTGRENVYLNGAILGMRRNEIHRKFDKIVEFAEVEKFLDTAVKHYSSGMYVRLAFSVAAHLDPEILIVDEVLAVGDAAFQSRCIEHFKKMKEAGKTILLISHNLSVVNRICDNSLLLDKGRLLATGDPEDVVAKYKKDIVPSLTESDVRRLQREDPERWGNGKARIISVSTANGDRASTVFRNDHAIDFVIEYESSRTLEGVILGLAIQDESGRLVFGTNSKELGSGPGRIVPGIVYRAIFSCDNVFSDGTYQVSCAINDSVRRPFARIENAHSFEVVGRTTFSPIWPRHSLKIESRNGS